MDRQSRKEKIEAYKQRKVIGGIYLIKNTVNGKSLLQSSTDLAGSKNRFEFSCHTGSCMIYKLKKDWEEFGKDVFVFEVLEELVKKETQTPKEFSEDIKTLEEIWMEKLDSGILY
ncbi:MAG: GIY-YIG nuclease family protein [Anaerovorax sp.]|nr:GIY-YIG nuclease family protein [Anaerovorax sp.]